MDKLIERVSTVAIVAVVLVVLVGLLRLALQDLGFIVLLALAVGAAYYVFAHRNQ